MEKKVVELIQKLCDEAKEQMHITDPVIRDDVFELLQANDCIVLYYPLPDEAESGDRGCAGCHIEKIVNGETRQFVFINTSNTRERQAFSVAQELGHIRGIDKQVYKKMPEAKSIKAEDIINRFAAELLMPEKEFCSVLKERLQNIHYNGKTIKETELVEISAYMMNYFFVPFKSVIMRYSEINRLQKEDLPKLEKYNDSDYLREIIKAKQYTRLLIVNEEKSMDNLQEILSKADKAHILEGNLVSRLREEFDLKNTQEGEDYTLAF